MTTLCPRAAPVQRDREGTDPAWGQGLLLHRCFVPIVTRSQSQWGASSVPKCPSWILASHPGGRRRKRSLQARFFCSISPGLWPRAALGHRAEQGSFLLWGVMRLEMRVLLPAAGHGGPRHPLDAQTGLSTQWVQSPGQLLLLWQCLLLLILCVSAEIKAAGSSLHGNNGGKSLVIKQSAAVLPGQPRQEINECVG